MGNKSKKKAQRNRELASNTEDVPVPPVENEDPVVPCEPEVSKLTVKVVFANDETKFVGGANIKFTVIEPGGAQPQKSTRHGEALVIENIVQGKYKVSLIVTEEDQAHFKLPDDETLEKDVTIGEEEAEVVFKVIPIIRIYLKLKFNDPEGEKRLFPEKFPLQILLDGDETIDAVIGDKGLLNDQEGEDAKAYIEIERKKQWFKLAFKQPGRSFIVCEKAEVGAEKKQEYVQVNDPFADDNKIKTAMVDMKRFFMIPTGDWTMANAEWDVAAAPVYTDNKFENLEDTSKNAGTETNPMVLTLKPKWQFIRFEYFDKYFGHGHHNHQRISIPPIILKGIRNNPAGDSNDFETASNWTKDDSDITKACQCLPWIINKADDGTDLAAFDKDMLLAFEAENHFAISTDEDRREIKKLDPTGADEDKLKPSVERPKYYDLPKMWKSKCYFTRLHNGKKFFDELLPGDIDDSFTDSKKLTFSLDDIVLVDTRGQEIKDKDKDDNDKDISKHSRVALLYLDPDPNKNFKVMIYRPRPEAAYHSLSELEKNRNVIIDYHVNTRVVIFCSGFYDIYNKRTEGADFTKNQIEGARVAKLNDGDISAPAVTFNTDADVAAGYVHMKRFFKLYYLHYCNTDANLVYSALVTYWSAQLICGTDNEYTAMSLQDKFNACGARVPSSFDANEWHMFPGTAAQKKRATEEGFENAMERWNNKDYQMEETGADKKNVIKPWLLLEPKEQEDPDNLGTFIDRGGEAIYKIFLINRTEHLGDRVSPGSSASMDSPKMSMRSEAFYEEGGLSATRDYDDNAGPRKLVFAHELGHAAIGLFDDYITKKNAAFGNVPWYQYKQRYPGVPFFRDKRLSIMCWNRATRLRQFWGRVKWVNDKSNEAPLQKFLNARQFNITYEPSGKAKLEYAVQQTSFYTPTHTDVKNLGSTAAGERARNSALHYYELGSDEFAQTAKGGPYTGMLVVETRIEVDFVNGLTPVVAAWVKNTGYNKSVCIEHDGKFYLCLETHPNSSDDFATDLAKWRLLDPDKAVEGWTAGDHYNTGDWIKSGADHYVCITGHDANTIVADTTANKIVKSNCKPDKWPDNQKKQWTKALNQDIVNMLEGAKGKFRLNNDTTHNLIYIRLFPQWWDGMMDPPPNDPQPYEPTQFKLKITRGGHAKFMYPRDNSIKVARESGSKAIIGYLYGKFSDVKATRAGQNLNTNVVMADLAKLKDWLDDKFSPDTFTLEAIPP